MHFRCPQSHNWDADTGAASCPICGAAATTRTLSSSEPSSEARARLERVINRFEDDWQNGTPPSVDAYLAEVPSHRDALLAELVQVDLEIRRKRGEAVQAEDYLTRFPRLAEIPGAVLDLLAREFTLRNRGGKSVEIESYCRRFPMHAAALRKRLGESDPEATRPPPPHSPGPRLVVAGYEVQGELGRGGMGVVYRAVQKATKRTVALKVMLSGPFATPRQQRRFEREIDLAASLRHPGIVTIYDSGVTPDGLHYFAMEFIEGVSLEDHLRRVQADVRERLQLFRKVGAAVAYAHQRGVIHRDLKPGNIRVDGDHEPHVLDFGLAKAAGVADVDDQGRPITASGEFIGTLAYASPEQAAGDLAQVDVRSDVYALGVILYKMLTGAFPYPVTGRIPEVLKNIAECEPRSPSSQSPEGGERIDEPLAAIVLKSLAKNPARRYQSVSAFVEDVERYLAGEAPEARPASMSFLLRSWVRRNFQATLGIVAIGLVCGLVGGLPRVLQRHLDVWRECAAAAQLFPDLVLPWPARLALALPEWVLDLHSYFWLLGYGGLGLFTALLVRPRDRDEDVVAGMAAGLVAGLSAFIFSGYATTIILRTYTDDVLKRDLNLLAAGYREPQLDPLADAHPSLVGMSAEEQTEAIRLRFTALAIQHMPHSLLAMLVYSLSLGGACGVAGTMAAGWLLRTRRLRDIWIPYLALAVPLMPLISALLLFPAGVSNLMQAFIRSFMTAVTVLALVRHWPARLIVPLYAAGVAAVARLDSGPLPAWLQLSAAALAVGAVIWHWINLTSPLPPSPAPPSCTDRRP
jgi:hypothetical protein